MKKRIAIVRGGNLRSFRDSVESGEIALKHLGEDYEVVDLVVDPDGSWSRDGEEILPSKALVGIDLVFNALHGHNEENQQVQKTLDQWYVPYTSAEPTGSALAYHKFHAKKLFKDLGIPSPHSWRVDLSAGSAEEISENLFKQILIPAVVKPCKGHGWEHVYSARTKDELTAALESIKEFTDDIIIEEYIEGQEVHVTVIENFRNEPFYTPFCVESRVGEDGTLACLPATTVLKSDYHKLREYSVEAHKMLHMKHYSVSDFIIHPTRGIFILETNSLPSLEENGIVQTGLESVGSSMREFLRHVVEEAAKEKSSK